VWGGYWVGGVLVAGGYKTRGAAVTTMTIDSSNRSRVQL